MPAPPPAMRFVAAEAGFLPEGPATVFADMLVVMCCSCDHEGVVFLVLSSRKVLLFQFQAIATLFLSFFDSEIAQLCKSNKSKDTGERQRKRDKPLEVRKLPAAGHSRLIT